MAYRVIYGPAVKLECSRAKGSARLRMLTAVCFLVMVLMVKAAWPEGRSLLRQAMLPQHTAVQTAFLELTENLQNGEPVGESVTAFCRELVEEALADD